MILANSSVISSSTPSAPINMGDIRHSLRFRLNNNANISRTFGTPTNNLSWALSQFIKRGSLAKVQAILSAGGVEVYFHSEDYLAIWKNGLVAQSGAFFRECLNHFHLLITSNGTYVKAYLNSILVMTYAGTLPTFNSAVVHRFGSWDGSSEFSDTYRSRIAFVDGGGNLMPADFITFNTTVNEWVSKTQSEVKELVDAGGNNSTMLDFDDATSLVTLGYDKSTHNNHWTLNNFSLTPGVTNDLTIDVPGSNFPVFSQLDKVGSYTLGTITDGNLVNTGTQTCTLGSMPVSIKSYWEITVSGAQAHNQIFGVFFKGGTAGSYSYDDSGAYGFYPFSLSPRTVVGAGTTTNPACPLVGTTGVTTTWQIAVDPVTNKMWLGKDGVFAGDPAAGTGNTINLPTGKEWFPWINPCVATSNVANINFGQRPFLYSPPTGFNALCQANMDTPSILNPREHFDAFSRQGTGNSSYTRSGLLFSPGMLWIKNRAAGSHYLVNKVRGISNVLFTDATTAETSYPSAVTAFNSDGYSLSNQQGNVNWSAAYIDWVFKAGGDPVTNNAGSIQSLVSADVSGGFSIVSFNHQASGINTVGHGLDVPPELIIVKSTKTASYGQWMVYMAALGNGSYMVLNAAGAPTATATAWNNTSPTSQVFTLGSGFNTANYGLEALALCIASKPGYSKLGTYKGGGTIALGPCVYCGFKPRFLFIKRIDGGTESWNIYDSARNTFNIVSNVLQVQSSVAEVNTHAIDFTSTGFKIKIAGPGSGNTSGATYFYWAIADVSAKYSLAR